MNVVKYGRRKLEFDNGKKVVTSTSITERSMYGENEEAFIRRLLEKYGKDRGVIEIVIKDGRPDYAIITIAHAS